MRKETVYRCTHKYEKVYRCTHKYEKKNSI